MASTGSTGSTGSGSGTAANESLSPFEIGLANTSEGVETIPGIVPGAEVAADYINHYLGGVDGHPVKIVNCVAGGDAASEQACGDQFANDASVNVVTTGYLFAGAGFYAALAPTGKPIVGGAALTPSDFTAKNTYFYESSSPGTIEGIVDFARQQFKPKSVAVISDSNPGGQEGATELKNAFKGTGVSVKIVSVSDSQADLSGPIVSSGAESASVFLPITGPQNCVQIAQALKQLSITAPVVTTVNCDDEADFKAAGPDMRGWYFINDAAFNDPPTGVVPDMLVYRQAWSKYGSAADINASGAVTAFSNVMTIAKVASKLPWSTITAKSLNTALASFTGPVFAASPTVKCPGATFPTICTLGYTVESYNAAGKFSLIDGGKFFTPSAG